MQAPTPARSVAAQGGDEPTSLREAAGDEQGAGVLFAGEAAGQADYVLRTGGARQTEMTVRPQNSFGG
ncbi:hypothetical protein [Streptomyces sp. NPDC005385]|uniref:hypothetical protein n=1 Tax=Streptomyces sp. NPDC005385 TaxID=3157039 RepID=UPI0033B960E1